MRKFYKGFFKQLAIDNQDILHSADNEQFFFVRDIYNPDAFDNAIKSKPAGFSLILENYSTKLGDNNNRNAFKHIQGRFNIVSSGETGNDESCELIQEQCEAIAEEILAKMRELLQEGNVITVDGESSKKTFFPVQEITIDPIGPISTNYWGVSVAFMLRLPAQGAATPGKWA